MTQRSAKTWLFVFCCATGAAMVLAGALLAGGLGVIAVAGWVSVGAWLWFHVFPGDADATAP